MIVKSRKSRVENQYNCGLRIADCGLKVPQNPKSVVRLGSPQVSRNPKSKRSALSLTEVLIAMGILTLGLLGVASVFPVGSYYMQKAEISDRGSAIAQSVMSDIVSRGMLNPWAWYAMVPQDSVQATAATPNKNWVFASPLIDGKYDQYTTFYPNTFTRPFAETLTEGLKLTNDPVTISRQFGNAFVIDPMYVAAQAPTYSPTNSINQSKNNRVAYGFPASASLLAYVGTNAKYYSAPQWYPWRVSATPNPPTSLPDPKELFWPIRRVTFQQSSGWPLDAKMAEHYFRGSDDLVTDFPPRDDRPAKQNWEVSGQTPLARQWTGDYSWLVTIMPTTTAARDGIARNPESFAYDVSVVVFYKRAFPLSSDPTIASSVERSVSAAILSTGLNGGELLLKDLGDGSTSAFEHLKTGEWIMLCGPHPDSNAYPDPATSSWKGEPRFALNWYQVVSIESDLSKILNSAWDPTKYRLITVRGPQWPWQPEGTIGDYTKLSNSLCVGIFRGAVAVHTKTLRLESPRNSAMGAASGAGMNLVNPATTTPSPYKFF